MMSPRGTMTSSIRRPRSARMFLIMVRSSGETPASPGPAASSTTSMSARVGPFFQPNNARASRAKKPSLSVSAGRPTGTGRLR